MATNSTPAPADPIAQLTAQLTAIQSAMKALQSAPGFSITTDFGAACNMVAKVCDLGLSPQGQAILGDWRAAGIQAESWISKAATAVVTWFKSLK
jgi:hypothetical protein